MNKYTSRYLLFFVLLFIGCNSNEEIKTPKSQKPKTEVKTVADKKANQNSKKIDHYICYNNNEDSSKKISIAFNKKMVAQSIKYKTQSQTISLKFIKEDFDKGEAHPVIDTYYSEIIGGKVTGQYKLTHAGIWDYVEYTSADGKKTQYTIDHITSNMGGLYRPVPCF